MVGISKIIQMEAIASDLSIHEVAESFRYMEKSVTWLNDKLLSHELSAFDNHFEGALIWYRERVEEAIEGGAQFRHSSKSMAYFRTYLINACVNQARQYKPFARWIKSTERKTENKLNLHTVIQMSKLLVAWQEDTFQDSSWTLRRISARYSEHWEYLGNLRVNSRNWLENALRNASVADGSFSESMQDEDEEVKWHWSGTGCPEVSLFKRNGVIYVSAVTAWEYTTGRAMFKSATFFEEHDDILDLFKNVMIHGTHFVKAAAFVTSYLGEDDNIFFLIAGLGLACEDHRVETLLRNLPLRIGMTITEMHESETVKPWISLNLKRTFELEQVETPPKLCKSALELLKKLENNVIQKSGLGERPPSNLVSEL